MTLSKRLFAWTFQHVGLKVLSLGLAVLLWMVVAGEETVERGLRIPLELQQMPGGLEMLGDVPATVDVRVRGASGTLSRVAPGDIIAVLDLRGARSGRRLFPLTADQVRVPFGVEIVQVLPSAVALAFETTVTRDLPIVPAVDGRPAPGYTVGHMAAEPRTAEVVGPETAVERATEVLTEPVPVTGAKADVRQAVTLGLLDPSLRLKTARSATVTVQIVPAPLERTLRHRPVHLRNVAPNLQAEAMPSTVDLTLRGDRDALSHFDADEIVVYIDLAGLGPGEYNSLGVRTTSSPDVGVMHVEPATVQVRINRGKD
ncbi:MAG TPA: CdaR family protein [Vicinamibacterales bacterium]|nr:CdaR family protein [Vicinamibacterales bacterium]